MHSVFRILRWAAWSPGLTSQDDWKTWLGAPRLDRLAGEALPPLTEIPPMTRRRIDPMGRAALQVAFWAQGGTPTGPVVFASRWGEIARSVALLRQLAQGESLSPTAFSLSVHNASAALYSIDRADTANYTALSAGSASATAGFLEAQGLLADGASKVLVVSVEQSLPAPYEAFETKPVALRAWAALIEGATGGIRLQATQPSAKEGPSDLPDDLAVLRYLTGTARAWHQHSTQGSWLWSRDD